jgi:surface polysaccharide O-acyltransferase-like enzyme
MSKSRNQLLNIVEAVATFLVVFIHFPFPDRAGTIIIAIARISVPFFFCVSGYFFYKENEDAERTTIPRKIKNLLRLILFSELTYILFYSALQIRATGFSLQPIISALSAQLNAYFLKNPMIYLAVFEPPFNGVCWFIGSLIAVYAILYVYRRWKKSALRVAIVLMLIGMLLRRILFYCGVQTDLPYEWLLPFLPFPFFVIGYHLRKYKTFCDKIDNRIYCAMLLVGIILTVAESFAGKHTLYFGTLLLVFVAIAFCGKYSQYEVRTHIGKLFSHIGGSTATYIYILHMIVGNIVYVLVPRMLAIDETHWLYLWGIPIMICIFSAIVAEFVVALKRVVFLKRR